MKNWILAIITVLLLIVLSVYVFIPSPIRISNSLNIKSSFDGSLRMIRKNGLWSELSGSRVSATDPTINGTGLRIASGLPKPVTGKIIVVPMNTDSLIVLWEFTMDTAAGPIDRVKKYFEAVSIKETMDKTMKAFRKVCEDTKMVYGMEIISRSTVDTMLVATRFKADHYPSNKEVYEKIEGLKKYVSSSGASVTGSPMLNINGYDTSFKCMVALPVNTLLKDSGNLFAVRMVPGRFLTAEIKGGPATIEHAREMMALYFQDFKRTSMAIPFEYMVTDRMQEKDTSKWITRLYSPVY